MPRLNEFSRLLNPLRVVGLALAAVALTLPWTNTGAASLSMSAFDLAEWTTIVPEVRYGGNAMALPYQLRLLVVLLIFTVTLLPNRRFSWAWFVCAGIALAGVAALLPPVEYFIDPGSGFRGDINYNQLMTIATTALGATVLGLSGLLWRFRRVAFPIISVMAVITAVSASTEALGYLNRYALAQTGVGVVMFSLMMGVTGLMSILPESKEGV